MRMYSKIHAIVPHTNHERHKSRPFILSDKLFTLCYTWHRMEIEEDIAMYDDIIRSAKCKRVEEIIAFIETATEGEKSKWRADLLLFTYVCESLAFNKNHEEREWLE